MKSSIFKKMTPKFEGYLTWEFLLYIGQKSFKFLGHFLGNWCFYKSNPFWLNLTFKWLPEFFYIHCRGTLNSADIGLSLLILNPNCATRTYEIFLGKIRNASYKKENSCMQSTGNSRKCSQREMLLTIFLERTRHHAPVTNRVKWTHQKFHWCRNFLWG